MQTNFTSEQLEDPSFSRSNEILRSCVHCGMCTATCPTYQVLGDELDSPRGRIYLIKDMLERERPADARTVKHIDRCLSCLACMTTCPSGVHYMHLVDHARAYIERTYRRPPFERFLRSVLSGILPYPKRLRLALLGARILQPFSGCIPDPRVRAIVEMAPRTIPPVSDSDRPQTLPAEGGKARFRVALSIGCVQRAINTDINDATIRVLRRFGCDVVIADGAGCCGALEHHMGRTEGSHAAAMRNIDAWTGDDAPELDAIVVNASGCGTTVKDYGFMLRNSPCAARARKVSELAVDVTEFLHRLDLPELPARGLRVAYHSACSLQHGQKVTVEPKRLLARLGHEVVEPSDSHLCCGSAGTYNLFQPEIAGQLRDRKTRTLEARNPDIVATGNIGCMVQIASGTRIPVVHTIELIDWATGGPMPRVMDSRDALYWNASR